MYWGMTELCFFLAQSISSQIFENKTNKQKLKKKKKNYKNNEKAAVIHRLVKFLHDKYAYLNEGTSYNSSWIHENVANENTAI